MGFENVNEQEILARIRRLSRDDATGAGNPPGSPLQPLGTDPRAVDPHAGKSESHTGTARNPDAPV